MNGILGETYNHIQSFAMISQLLCVLLGLLSQVLADYHADYSGQSAAYNNYNTYYPDYGYAYNNSLTESTGHTKRIFNDEDFDFPLAIGISVDMEIPVEELDTTIYISAPFSYEFPSGESRITSGRSFSSSIASPRSTIYKHIEKYMGQVTGADGHSCLLRAMCEASSTPLHGEGVFGDVVNFLLTGIYAAGESNDKFKNYLGAQSKGQVNTTNSK